MIANLIEVEFNGVGNWPLGAALSLVSMAMVAVDRRPVCGRRPRRGKSGAMKNPSSNAKR